MKKQVHFFKCLPVVLAAVSFSVAGSANAGAKDDPLLTMVKIDQFEKRFIDNETDPVVLDAQAWVGYDLRKIWVKSEIERVDGEYEEAELDLVYSQAIATYWDAQVGVRHDFKPTPEQTWLAIGLQGVAPYFFEIDTTLFVGEGGQNALRIEAEYELPITQKLILSPEAELNFYSKNDEDREMGSGLSDGEIGIRLRYEFIREFAPYIGVNWSGAFGNAKEFIEKEGEDSSQTEYLLGLRAWF